MSPLLLGCIGDDYTGSSDLANALTRAGLRTVQTIGVPDDGLALPEVDAVVVALKIRSVAAADAVAQANAARDWLRNRGAGHILYKVCSTFDSTDEGNIGPVLDALRGGDGGVVPVTPAFPEAGRTLYCGNLFVDGVPLNESPLKDHPLNPMHDANLVRVLARQSRGRVGLVPLGTVAQGSAAIAERMQALAAHGFAAAIVDAVADADLTAIGAAAAPLPLSIGASGLGIGLARALRRGDAIAPAAPPPLGGPLAALSGSCSAATLAQVDQAERWMAVRRLDVAALVEGDGEIRAALAWALERLAREPVLIASSAAPDAVRALQARFGRMEAGRLVEHALAEIAAGLAAAGVRRMMVAGGETSGAVVDRLALPGFLIGAEIAPGVPVLRSIGGAHGPMAMALKSGNFGGPDFFADAAALMP